MKKIEIIIERIKRIINWIPTLWQAHEWDYTGLYRVMAKQLERMENSHRKYGTHINADKIADNIKVARILSKRLAEQSHLHNALMHHRRKWGEIKRFFDIEWEKARTESENQQANREFSKWGNHADEMEKRDREYLFDWINRYISTWWD